MSWWRRWQEGEPSGEEFARLVELTEGGSQYAYASLAHHLIESAIHDRQPDHEESAWLRGQEPFTWRRLDGAARSNVYYDVYPSTDALRRLLEPDCSTLLAVMASFHRSGYLRESAVRILTAHDDTLADKALALRTADWVDVVRQQAQLALLDRGERRHALAIVPVLVALLDQERSKGYLDEYISRLQPHTIGDLARFGSRGTRRLLADRPEIANNDLLERAIADDDSLVRFLAARALLTRKPDSAAELLVRGSGVVRAIALVQAPADLVIEREQDLLLERRATARRAAQLRLSRLGRDVVGRYRGLVKAQKPVPTAILGLGETGSQEDAPTIVELLEREDEAIRLAALSALRWVVSEPVLIEIAARALHDNSDLVVRGAARLLRRRASRIPKHVIDEAIASSSRTTHLAGLRLARRSDGWSRLEADLTLAVDSDQALAREGRQDLASWVGRVAPTLYTAPPHDQLDSIRRLLDGAQLDTWLDGQIRFHCGIKR